MEIISVNEITREYNLHYKTETKEEKNTTLHFINYGNIGWVFDSKYIGNQRLNFLEEVVKILKELNKKVK